MAEEKEPKKAEKDNTVKGYSGSPHEGQKITRPKGASDDAVISPLGATEPSREIREKQT